VPFDAGVKVCHGLTLRSLALRRARPRAYPPGMSEAIAERIPPSLTDASRPFWTGGEHGQLLILWCGACRRWVHPPRGSCPACGGPLEPRTASGRGTVFTFTVNRQAFRPDVPVPYVIAIVELEEQSGLRFTTNIVGCDPAAVRIGMPVTVAFEQAGGAPGIWVPVFRPAPPEPGPQSSA
jgi:uncharacterized protein